MLLPKYEGQTGKEYLDMAKVFASLVDSELVKLDIRVHSGKDGDMHDAAGRLPALISLVDSIRFLRGDEGMFTDIRPSLGEDQSVLYGLEDEAERRLNQIIEAVMASPERDYYEQQLDSYFVKVRTLKKPTVY